MKKALTILFVICLAHFQYANAKVKILHKSLDNFEKRLVFDHRSYVDERLTYALCDRNAPTDEVKCTVIREKQPYSDDTYSCNVTLKRGENNGKKQPQIEVIPFGEHFAILYLLEADSQEEKNYFVKFTIVQLDNCKVSEAAIDTATFILDHVTHDSDFKVVGHSNSFDVFFGNDKVSCAGKTCKATIGTGGNVTQPIPSFGSFVRKTRQPPIFSLDDGSSASGYFYVKRDEDEYVQTLVKPDGTEKSLAQHSKPPGALVVSTKNNLIGVCYQTNSEYNCSQYDFDGNSKLQPAISRDYTNKTQLAAIYNSANGGFYVLSGMCGRIPEGHIDECHGGRIRLVIERIDANGAKSEPLTIEVPHYYLTNNLAPLFYENESKETCLSLVAYASGDTKEFLDLTANCFTEADFSK